MYEAACKTSDPPLRRTVRSNRSTSYRVYGVGLPLKKPNNPSDIYNTNTAGLLLLRCNSQQKQSPTSGETVHPGGYKSIYRFEVKLRALSFGDSLPWQGAPSAAVVGFARLRRPDRMELMDSGALATEDLVIDQLMLEAMASQHERFVTGREGGQRLNLALRVGKGLRFDGLDLSDAELRGARLEQCSFVGTRLLRANLFGADLRYADMRDSDLSHADLRGAMLRGANLENAILVEVDARSGDLVRRLRGGALQRINADAEVGLPSANMRGVDMTSAKVSSQTLRATDLTNAILRKANLSGADLSYCTLRGVQLDGADMTGANLSHSVLHGAMLRGALLNDAELDQADLNAAVFDHSLLADCNTTNALLPQRLERLDRPLRDVLESHRRWIQSMARDGSRADFAGFDLSGQDLRGLELSAAQFSRALMAGTQFGGASLSMAQLDNANGFEADFAHANLRGANLEGATLTRAVFRYLRADAVPIVGSRNTIWPTNFSRTILDGACFEEGSLVRADFAQASLRSADFRGARLVRARFLDADLSGADFRGADVLHADFRGAIGFDPLSLEDPL